MSSALTPYISQRLKTIRQRKNMTQLEIAKKAKMNPNAYAKIEQGKQTPKLETLEKIIKALGVKSSDILPF